MYNIIWDIVIGWKFVFNFYFIQANKLVTILLDINPSADIHLEDEVIMYFYHVSSGLLF